METTLRHSSSNEFSDVTTDSDSPPAAEQTPQHRTEKPAQRTAAPPKVGHISDDRFERFYRPRSFRR